jgi:hypothetical protein
MEEELTLRTKENVLPATLSSERNAKGTGLTIWHHWHGIPSKRLLVSFAARVNT